jgi:hypothetical protein
MDTDGAFLSSWGHRRALIEVLHGWPTRTKPQAPRLLQQCLASSVEAGIGCESQEVNRRMLKQP